MRACRCAHGCNRQYNRALLQEMRSGQGWEAHPAARACADMRVRAGMCAHRLHRHLLDQFVHVHLAKCTAAQAPRLAAQRGLQIYAACPVRLCNCV